MNPCKCGYLGDSYKECVKAPKCGDDYKMKISGPIMDRFDSPFGGTNLHLPDGEALAWHVHDDALAS